MTFDSPRVLVRCSAWELRRKAEPEDIPFVGQIQNRSVVIEPGEGFTLDSRLHYQYKTIMLGSYTVEYDCQFREKFSHRDVSVHGSFSLTIAGGDAEDKEWRRLALDIDTDDRPPSPLRPPYAPLDQVIAARAVGEHDAMVAFYLYCCAAPKAIRPTLQLMDKMESADVVGGLFDNLYRNVRPLETIDQALLDGLLTNRSNWAGHVFWKWFVEKQHTPTDEQLRPLKSSKNPYVRIMLLAARPALYDRIEKQKLLIAIDYLAQELMPELPGLIDDLDNDSAEIRNAARIAIVRLGRITEPALRDALESSRTIKKSEIIKGILKDLAPTDHRRIADKMLYFLGTLNSVGAKEILEHLASKHTSSWISVKAKEWLSK